MLHGPLQAQQFPVDTDRWNAAALEWVRFLRDGDFSAAAARVDPAVPEAAMSEARLATVWEQATAQLGQLQSLTPGPVSEVRGSHVVDLVGTFERMELNVRVVFNDSLQVSGFFFRPIEAPVYEAPAYVDTTTFREEEVTIGEEPWALPGVLSLPAGAGPFPAVVLVHGSGPNDRDETIGGHRPFRDLAWGLSSRGIAVLRYDKRTQVHANSVPSDIGLDDEVINDAASALALARSRPEVAADQVFVLGHSLGGMLVPEIAARVEGLAGGVVLAGPARPFLEVLRSQLAYLAGLETDSESPNRVAIDSILGSIDRYGADGTTPDGTLMGVPLVYWEEILAVDPVATARSLDTPMLILQGGRDYQVTEADLALWREGLAGRDDVQTRLYPNLNHLFFAGEGMAVPLEYMSGSDHVAPEVVDDIAQWILEVRR